MELNERKLNILKAVIDDYIMTGLPIGSRTISRKHGIDLSSATIRNEMADLEEMGYLEQPHTSAGRVPSNKAYRFYVDRLMNVVRLNSEEARRIRGYFENRVSEIEQVMERAAQVLSDTTHHISMVLKPQLKKSQIRRIQIVRITEKKAILLVVTSAGLVKDTMITIPEGTPPDCLEMISNMLTDKLTGKTLEDAEQDLVSCVRDRAQENARFVAEVLQVIESSVEPQGERGIVLSGTQNIIDYPEYMSLDRAKNFVSLLETKEMLYDMMKKATQLEFSITIGTENEAQELYDMSVVTATYKLGGRALGSFGVIGPTRMDYAKIVSILGYVGSSLDSILTNFIETDE